ncbi:DNA-binding anti-repressor SinI [Heyndrickxia sporothermodurans]
MDNQLIRKEKKLDQDWVDLILAAFDMGMSAQEIKEYFSKQKVKEKDL